MHNPLTAVLPPRVRAIAYAIVFVLSLGFMAWQASDGNKLEFAFALVTSLGSALAVSNVSSHEG